MHTYGSVPLVHVYPVCDWWNLPLSPASDRRSLDRWGGEEVRTGRRTVTDAGMDHKHWQWTHAVTRVGVACCRDGSMGVAGVRAPANNQISGLNYSTVQVGRLSELRSVRNFSRPGLPDLLTAVNCRPQLTDKC